jgi:enoyl-CoA hydratase
MHSTSEKNTQSTAASDRTVLVDPRGALGHIRLNRPKALNSLTLDMVRKIDAALDDFEHDPQIAAVLVTGEGERGLCAGGDIRAMHDGGKAADGSTAAFWSEEYRLNARISRYPKPYVAVMDGIVMGGGAGLSVHASHRVVTERTRLAMPETGIGFFPDVGASWFLTRRPGECTTYMALTGETAGAGDAIMLGLADSCVASDRLNALADALTAASPDGGGQEVSAIIGRFAAPPPAETIWPHRDAIDRLFAFERIEDILAALDREDDDFARTTATKLRTRSPISLKVTLRLLRLGRKAHSLEECLEREFTATRAVLESHDFYEGVRAAIIDKDRNPQWRPVSLAEVSADQVDAYFPKTHQKLFEA